VGNKNDGQVSLFLENLDCSPDDGAQRDNPKFHVCAQFAMALIHPSDNTVYKTNSKGFLPFWAIYIYIYMFIWKTNAFAFPLPSL
jgi:hypothetical protein